MVFLDLLDRSSRMSSRSSTKAQSRTSSPTFLVAEVSAKLQPKADDIPVAETLRVKNFGPDLFLTQVFRDMDAADMSEDENRMRHQKGPKMASRDNTHACRDSYNATHRPSDPLKTRVHSEARCASNPGKMPQVSKGHTGLSK